MKGVITQHTVDTYAVHSRCENLDNNHAIPITKWVTPFRLFQYTDTTGDR